MAPIASTIVSHASFLTENNPYKKIFEAGPASPATHISNIEQQSATFKEITTLDPSFKRIFQTQSLQARANGLIDQIRPGNLIPQIHTATAPPTMAIVVIAIVAVGLIGMLAWGVYCRKKARANRKEAKVVGEGRDVVGDGEMGGYEMGNMEQAEQAENAEEVGDLGVAAKVREMV